MNAHIACLCIISLLLIPMSSFRCSRSLLTSGCFQCISSLRRPPPPWPHSTAHSCSQLCCAGARLHVEGHVEGDESLNASLWLFTPAWRFAPHGSRLPQFSVRSLIYKCRSSSLTQHSALPQGYGRQRPRSSLWVLPGCTSYRSMSERLGATGALRVGQSGAGGRIATP